MVADCPSQNQNFSPFLPTSGEGSSVLGANSICPGWLICKIRAAFKISSGILMVCFGVKVAGSYSTIESGCLSTQRRRLWAVAETARQATMTMHLRDLTIRFSSVLGTVAAL